jgi:hypothetical protein
MEYPEIKKDVWQCLRAFVSGFLGSAATVLLLVDKSMLTDWETFRETFIISLMVAGLTGGFVALGKTLRSLFGGEDYEGAIHKLPF